MANKPFEIQDGIKIQTGDDILNSTGTSAFAGGGSANLGDITVENANTLTIEDARLGLRSFNPYGSEAKIELDAYRIRSQVSLSNSRNYNTGNGFDSAEWVSGEGSTITFTNLQQYVKDFLNTDLGNANNITVQINGSGSEYTYSYFNGTDQIYIATNPETSPVTVTEIRFSYKNTSYINIDPDESDLDILSAPGVDIRITAGDDLFMTANDRVRLTAGSDLDLRSGDDYVTIVTNYDIPNATQHNWYFSNDGNLTLPDGGDIRDSTGASVLGGAGSNSINNGEYSVSVAPDGVVSMVTSRGTLEFGALPEPGGPDHFHIMKGPDQDGSGGIDLYFGDDYNYVLQRPAASNDAPAYGVEIGANDRDGGDQHVWRFDTDGRLGKAQDLTLTTSGQFNICTIQTAGNGYTSSTPIPAATTGGTGTGMTVGYGYGLSGELANVSVVNPGTGYTNGDVITVNGGTGTFVLTRYNDQANQANNNTVESDWVFSDSGNLTLPRGSAISETATTTVITPPGAAAGQSLVVRPTAGQFSLTTDHPDGFVPGETITITVGTLSGDQTGTLDYQFTGATSQQLGRATTGTLTFTSETEKTITWTVPAQSSITTFTFSLIDATGFDGQGGVYVPGLPNFTITLDGTSVEVSHVHLMSGDPTTVDLYLGDDDQYVKIEKNGGDVIVGTNSNTNRWSFDTDGVLTLPQGSSIDDTITGVLITGAGQTAVNRFYAKVSNILYETVDAGVTYQLANEGGLWGIVVLGQDNPRYRSADLVTWTDYGGGLPAPTGTVSTRSTTLTVNSNTWAFGGDGSLTFPGGSKIETDYAGDTRLVIDGVAQYVDIRSSTGILIGNNSTGTITIGNSSGGAITEIVSNKVIFINQSVPASSVGAPGDSQGMIAFDDTYMYYCKQNYGVNATNLTTLASSGTSVYVSSADYPGDLVADFTGNPTGWTYAGVTIVSVAVDNQFGPGYVLEGVTSFGASNDYDYGLVSPITPNIWKRTAHGTGTW